MKQKKINKKLELRKETIADIGKAQMIGIKGGADSDPGSTCKFCPTDGTLCTPTTRCPSPPVTDTDCYETIEYACFTLPQYGGFC